MKTFNQSGANNWGKSVQQTRDGGYIIAGEADDPLGGMEIWLIKTDDEGDVY